MLTLGGREKTHLNPALHVNLAPSGMDLLLQEEEPARGSVLRFTPGPGIRPGRSHRIPGMSQKSAASSSISSVSLGLFLGRPPSSPPPPGNSAGPARDRGRGVVL